MFAYFQSFFSNRSEEPTFEKLFEEGRLQEAEEYVDKKKGGHREYRLLIGKSIELSKKKEEGDEDEINRVVRLIKKIEEGRYFCSKDLYVFKLAKEYIRIKKLKEADAWLERVEFQKKWALALMAEGYAEEFARTSKVEDKKAMESYIQQLEEGGYDKDYVVLTKKKVERILEEKVNGWIFVSGSDWKKDEEGL